MAVLVALALRSAVARARLGGRRAARGRGAGAGRWSAAAKALAPCDCVAGALALALGEGSPLPEAPLVRVALLEALPGALAVAELEPLALPPAARLPLAEGDGDEAPEGVRVPQPLLLCVALVQPIQLPVPDALGVALGVEVPLAQALCEAVTVRAWRGAGAAARRGAGHVHVGRGAAAAAREELHSGGRGAKGAAGVQAAGRGGRGARGRDKGAGAWAPAACASQRQCR